MKKIIPILKGAMITSVFLFAGIASADFFQIPTDTPPNGNTDAPINVGSSTQTKIGHLSVLGYDLTNLSYDLGIWTQNLVVNNNAVVSQKLGVGFYPPVTPTDTLDVNGKIHLVATTTGTNFAARLYNVLVGGVNTLYWDGSPLVTGGSGSSNIANGNIYGQTLYWNTTASKWATSTILFNNDSTNNVTFGSSTKDVTINAYNGGINMYANGVNPVPGPALTLQSVVAGSQFESRDYTKGTTGTTPTSCTGISTAPVYSNQLCGADNTKATVNTPAGDVNSFYTCGDSYPTTNDTGYVIHDVVKQSDGLNASLQPLYNYAYVEYTCVPSTQSFSILTNTGNLQFNNSGNIPVITVFQNGNAGFGTTTPSQKVSVNGAINLISTSTVFSATSNALNASGNDLYWNGQLLNGGSVVPKGNLIGQTLYWTGTNWSTSSILFNYNSANNVTVGSTTAASSINVFGGNGTNGITISPLSQSPAGPGPSLTLQSGSVSGEQPSDASYSVCSGQNGVSNVCATDGWDSFSGVTTDSPYVCGSKAGDTGTVRNNVIKVTSGSPAVYFYYQNSFTCVAGNSAYHILTDNGDLKFVNNASDATNPAVVVQQNGNVGIGTTTNINQALVVDGNIKMTGQRSVLFTQGDNNTTQVGGVQFLTYDNGLHNVWTPTDENGVTATSTISLGGHGNFNSNTVNLYVTGTTTSIGLTLPTGAGLGKILTSDGSGNASWQTPESTSAFVTFAYASSTFASTSFVTTNYVPYNNATGPVNLNGKNLTNVATFSAGTTTLSGTLGVTGTTTLTGGLNLPSNTTNGTAALGKVLSSDAAGNATWVATSSLFGSGLPAGMSGQTLYHNGAAWTPTSNLYHDGTKVGIGTTNPASILDVFTADASGNSAVFSGNVIVRNGNALNLRNSPNDSNAVIRNTSVTAAQNQLDFMGGKMVITNSGNVGINTTSPITGLDVAGPSGNAIIHVAGDSNPTVTSQGAYFGWNALNGGTGETDFINNKGSGPGGFAFMNSDAITNPSLFINGRGNVGIGTTNPVAKLDLGAPNDTVGNVLRIGGDNNPNRVLSQATSTYGTYITYGAMGSGNSSLGNAETDFINNVWTSTTGGGFAFYPQVLTSTKNLSNPALFIDGFGRIKIATTTVPSPTTDQLYNIQNGAVDDLYWNGINLSGAGTIPKGNIKGQTLYYDGGKWATTTNIFNDAVANDVRIGTTTNGAQTLVYNNITLAKNPDPTVTNRVGSALVLESPSSVIGIQTFRTKSEYCGQTGQPGCQDTTGTGGGTDKGSATLPYTCVTLDLGKSFIDESIALAAFGTTPAQYQNAYISCLTGKTSFSILTEDGTLKFNSTTGSTKLSITQDGNVGIGTTTPVSSLEVKGTTPLVTAAANFVLPSASTNFDDDFGAAQLINTNKTVANNYTALEFADDQLGTSGAGIYAIFRNHTTNQTDLAFLTNAGPGYKERMRIMSDGKVGIGTTSPVDALDVIGGNSQIHFSNTAVDSGGYLISVASHQAILSGGANFTGTTWVAKSASSSIIGASNGSVGFYSDTGLTPGSTFVPTSRMLIDSIGNVGIGTTTPTQKLAVNGAINLISTTTVFGATSNALNASGNDLYWNGAKLNGASAAIPNGNLLGQTLYWNQSLTKWATSTNIFNNNSNVGIGTVSPSSKLSVLGDIKVVREPTSSLAPGPGHSLVIESPNNAISTTIFGGVVPCGILGGTGCVPSGLTNYTGTATNIDSTDTNPSVYACSATTPASAYGVRKYDIYQTGSGATAQKYYIEFECKTDTSAYTIYTNAGDLRFKSDGNKDYFTILQSNGNVGIDTIAPATKLDVNGQVTIRSGGAATGSVLISSDAQGTAVWSNPSLGTGLGQHMYIVPAGTTSWTVPVGISSVIVEMWGAGGGGGSGGNSSNAALQGGYGGGGGAGAYEKMAVPVTPGAVTIQLGAGGGGASGCGYGCSGSKGTNGTQTWFSSASYAANGGIGGGGGSCGYGCTVTGGSGGSSGTTSTSTTAYGLRNNSGITGTLTYCSSYSLGCKAWVYGAGGNGGAVSSPFSLGLGGLGATAEYAAGSIGGTGAGGGGGGGSEGYSNSGSGAKGGDGYMIIYY